MDFSRFFKHGIVGLIHILCRMILIKVKVSPYLIYVGNNQHLIDEFKKSMINEFEMIDLSMLSYFLSIADVE